MNNTQDFRAPKNQIRVMKAFLITMIVFSLICMHDSFAETEDSSQEAFDHLLKGEYDEAIKVYDQILSSDPQNVNAHKIKGIAHSNQGLHKKSLIEFYIAYEKNPNDPVVLNGLAVGFGYLGEYQEAKTYLEKSLETDPENKVTWTYKEFIDKIISKYPYTPTQKPAISTEQNQVPHWIKGVAKWWSQGKINDAEFVNALTYLLKIDVIRVEITNEKISSNSIPDWLKDNSGLWADGKISDADFLLGIAYLIQSDIIHLDSDLLENIKGRQDQRLESFDAYLNKILSNISKEKRYIEFPNPSSDVIKKFLRDRAKWNFEEQIKLSNAGFPDPETTTSNGYKTIHYKVYVNEQPQGLPLDHIITVNEATRFWQDQTFGKTRVEFSQTTSKSDANVWVTWVVRELGQNRIGHAHLGKGIVEVTLGDYRCDGSFELYDIDTVRRIMIHELGHSIGLGHSTDQNNIMYPELRTNYAYCLLN